MIRPDNGLFTRVDQIDQMPGSEQEQQRLQTLAELGLLEPENVPIFEEATQTAAHFLEATICFLGLMDRDRLWLRSAVGLSRIGLMNELASSRQLPRQDSFCAHMLAQQILMIGDTTADSALSNSVLVQRYGIRSYLGVPLMSSNGQYLGTLAVMGLTPRSFTSKDADVLQLIARWSISEFERDRVIKHSAIVSTANHISALPNLPNPSSPTLSIKSQLIAQMIQELCTPLTSVLGMARVLSQGIYGALTDKQKEYIEIIHNSGQHLSSIVNEVMELGSLADDPGLNLNPIDIEMLCQQALNTLKQSAQRHNQQIQLTTEPGPRIWLLDKDKVRQMLYHLVFSVMQSSTPESIIRIHISRRQECLNLAVWTSHPWLGEGLSQTDLTPNQPINQLAVTTSVSEQRQASRLEEMLDYPNQYSHPYEPLNPPAPSQAEEESSRYNLGLLLSRNLAELHGGSITVQGSFEEGHRYVIKLPQLRNKNGQD